MEEKQKNLREMAFEHNEQQIKNIADLKRVPLNLPLSERTGEKDGAKFTYYCAIIDGIVYRVPGIVLGGIKKVVENYPECTHVIVNKEGEGLNTKYYVFPYFENIKGVQNGRK